MTAKKTLFECADDYGDPIEALPNGEMAVYADRTRYVEDYWHLSDYRVSSRSGHFIYFVRSEPQTANP